MFGVKGELGTASLSFSKPGGTGKNTFPLPHSLQGLSIILGGRGADMLSLSSATLLGVGLEAVTGGLVESRVLMSKGQTPVGADAIMSQAYNLASFNPRVSRIFLILKCMGLCWGEDVTLRLEDSDNNGLLFDHTFDVREAGQCEALVLGVMERTDDGWRAGPVGVLAERYSSLWAARILPTLSEHWTVGLPNPLSSGWRQTQVLPEAFAHLVAHVPDTQLPATYQQGLVELGQNFTSEYATDLLARLVYQWSQKALNTNQMAVANHLVANGADWREIFFDAELNDEQCISALIRVGQTQPSWAALILNTYPLRLIVEYAVTMEKADAVYQLVPHECLLDRVSEHRRVTALEQDLGL